MSEKGKPQQYFSHDMDLKLIRQVEQYPMLYDLKHDKYKDLICKEAAWQKIGDQLQRAATLCKTRWINIRDFHRKLVLRAIRNPDKKVNPYKYDSALSFMHSCYMDTIPGIEVVVEEENDPQCDNNDSYLNNYNSEDDEPIRTVVKKGKENSNKRRKTEPEDETFVAVNEPIEYDYSDPVETFLRTIGATLKTFSPYRLNLVKSQMFSLVQEHDLQQLMLKKKGMSDDGDDEIIVLKRR